jgi:hypothetical protein
VSVRGYTLRLWGGYGPGVFEYFAAADVLHRTGDLVNVVSAGELAARLDLGRELSRLAVARAALENVLSYTTGNGSYPPSAGILGPSSTACSSSPFVGFLVAGT